MWAQICTILLGVWLMISPYTLHFDAAPDTLAHVAGPIVIATGVASCRDVTRGFRYFNLLPAFWLVLAPWFLHIHPSVALVNEELTAVAIVVCAVIPSRVRQQTGGGWLSLL